MLSTLTAYLRRAGVRKNIICIFYHLDGTDERHIYDDVASVRQGAQHQRHLIDISQR